VLDFLAGTLLRAKKKNEQEPEAVSSLWTFLAGTLQQTKKKYEQYPAAILMSWSFVLEL
jgi:hypothetical protein